MQFSWLCSAAACWALGPSRCWQIVIAVSAPGPPAWARFSVLHECGEAKEHLPCLHLIGIVSLCLLLGSLLSSCQQRQQWADYGNRVGSWKPCQRTPGLLGFMWLQLWLLHVWLLKRGDRKHAKWLLFQKCKYWTMYCPALLLKSII